MVGKDPWEKRCQRELARARRSGRPVSVVMLDLDHLRELNQRYGHKAGDAIIAVALRRLQALIQPPGMVARAGGEEFVLLLPGMEAAQAQHWLQQVVLAAGGVRHHLDDGLSVSCTVSGGVASFPLHGQTVAELRATAAAALHEAKRAGGDRVCTAVQSEPEAQAASPAGKRPGPAGANPWWRREALWVLVGATAVILSFLTQRVHLGHELLVLLCAAGFATEYWRVDLLSDGESRYTVSLGVAVTMAAAATLGPLAAVAVNLANFGAHLLQVKRRRLVVLVGNLAAMLLCAGVASLPLAAVRTRSSGFDLWFMGAVLVGSMLYFVVNVGMIALLVARLQGESLMAVWRERYLWVAPGFIFTAACGGMMGMAYLHLGWPAVPVFVLPLLIIRQSHRVQLRRSREAYETAEQGRLALAAAHRLQGRSMEQLIEVISTIIDARDASVSGHSQQVARYAEAIAREMGLPEAEVGMIKQAALLHDLGKIGIPEAILHKPARLSPEEWAVMREHTRIGERILSQVDGLTQAARMVGEHHEQYGGKGYPRGLSHDGISLGARIIALADALDSMLSDRPYATAKSLHWAIAEIERCSGDHFDPAVVDAFFRVVSEVPEQFFVNSAAIAACAQQA